MIYEPAEDSFLLQKQVKKYSKGKSVLDIGTGSGIQIETAREFGAKKVLATDINKEVLGNLKKKKINFKKSNLFANISKRFDLIIFNPPYLPKDEREDIESQLTTTGGKKGDEIILRFLKQSINHLNKKGTILILISSLTPRKEIKSLLKKLKLKKKKLAEIKLFMEKLEVWELKSTNQDNNQ